MRICGIMERGGDPSDFGDDDDGNDRDDNDGCGGDRGSSELGGVCRDDCDCASDYSCYEDDYAEQCCARELADLENGAWGIDCDGVQ